MTLTPHNRFFGNLTNADYKLQEIFELSKDFEKIIKEKDLELVPNYEFDEDPESYSKKKFFEDIFTRGLRFSIIINLITFLEIELHSYCSEMSKCLDLEIKHNDIKGSILEQFKVYSNKVCSLHIDLSSGNWQSLKELIELRNCIVHYDGQVEDWYGRKFNRIELLKNLKKKFNFMQIHENQFVELSEDAGPESILIVQHFINHIYQKSFEDKIACTAEKVKEG